MGGCCYTPGRREFLWWYWLILTFVFCIPMTIAALVVRRANERAQNEGQSAPTDAAETKKRGRRAFAVFLLASAASLALALLAGWLAIRDPAFCTLGLSFAGGLLLATAADRARRHRTWEGSRVFPFLFFGIIWVMLWFGGCVLFPDALDRNLGVSNNMAEVAEDLRQQDQQENVTIRRQPSDSVDAPYRHDRIISFPPSTSCLAAILTFLACMIPAHFWGDFTARPTRDRAAGFLIALACGCLLYWAILRYL